MASQDKSVILVTGANSGIGFEAVVQLLAASANNHVLLGSRSVSKGEAALKDITSRNLPGSVSLLQVEITDEESIKTAAKQVEKDFGRLDVLVNNAGVAPMEGTIAEQIRRAFETNVVGTELVTVGFEQLLAASTKTPRIINVSTGLASIAGRLDPSNGYFGVDARGYRISKSGMSMLTACQWAQYREKGWKVFAYCPGFTESNLTVNNKAEYGAQPVGESVKQLVRIVMGEKDADDGKFHNSEGGYWPW